jgi:hypothetical protein
MSQEKVIPTIDEIRAKFAEVRQTIQAYELCLDATIDDYPIGRRDRLLSKPATIVSAVSLTAAPAAQDNAFWLAGEVLAGEATASLDPPKTAPD